MTSRNREVLVPSINFAMLCPGIYRSGYPTKKNFPFLKALKLRSICYLCPEEYASTNQKFCEENGIQVLRFPMEGNKEPFVDIPEQRIHLALTALLDTTRNHPILIHCNKGKHRTGALSGCVRRTQGWCLSSIFAEYIRFAGNKARAGDQQCIELYRPVVLLHPGCIPRWFVKTPDITVVTTVEELAQHTIEAPPPAESGKKEKKDKKDNEKEKEKASECCKPAEEPAAPVATEDAAKPVGAVGVSTSDERRSSTVTDASGAMKEPAVAA